MSIEYEQPKFQKEESNLWRNYPKSTMYHNLPDDEPDNKYIKFIEEITNANFY